MNKPESEHTTGQRRNSTQVILDILELLNNLLESQLKELKLFVTKSSSDGAGIAAGRLESADPPALAKLLVGHYQPIGVLKQTLQEALNFIKRKDLICYLDHLSPPVSSGPTVAMGITTSGPTSQPPDDSQTASAPGPTHTAENIPPEIMQALSDLKTAYNGKLSRVTPFPWMRSVSLLDLKKSFHTLHLVTRDTREKLRQSKNVPFPELLSSLREKTPVKLCDIFNLHGNCEKFPHILIEGEPGIGKTSLCIKLAADWSQGEAYMTDKFDGVFFIRARNIKYDNFNVYFSKHLHKPLDVEQLLRYIRGNQNKFCFIIDGLDEVVHPLPDDWIDLIKGDQFINSCVLVTSRTNQWQSKLANNSEDSQLFDTEIVNIGFTVETAFEFIRSLSRAEQSDFLPLFTLDKIPILSDLIRSPLMCIFLCFMLKEGYFSENIEETKFRRTGFYVNLIKCLVKRLSARLQKTASTIQDKLVQVYKVAYCLLLEGKVQASLRDIQQYLEDSSIDESDLMFSLGILVKEIEFDLIGCEEEEVFVFPHRTVQEELAAEHYLKMPEEERAAAAEQIVEDFPLVAIFISGLVDRRELDPSLAVPLFKELANKHRYHAYFTFYVDDHVLECVYECNYQEQLTSIIAESFNMPVEVYPNTPEVLSAFHSCLMNDKSHTNSIEIGNRIPFYVSVDLYADLTKKVLISLFKKRGVEYFEFSGAVITDKFGENLDSSWKDLTRSLKANTELTRLSLEKSSICGRGCEALAEGLKTNTTLTSLVLSWCTIDDRGWIALAGLLKANTTLKKLYMNHCVIQDTGYKAITRALKTNTALTELDMSRCYIANSTRQAGRARMENQIPVGFMTWRIVPFSDEGCQALGEALEVNKTLTKLDLWECKITEMGCKSFAKGLKANQGLTQLNLLQCEIGNGGCEALARALENNTALKELYLRHCMITDSGMEALAKALKTNAALTRLDIHGSKITDGGWEALAGAIKINKGLTQLSITDGQCTDRGWRALTGALEINPALEISRKNS